MSFLKTILKPAGAALLVSALAATVAGQGEPITSAVPRADEVRALIATLQSQTTGQHDKVLACHRLAIIGAGPDRIVGRRAATDGGAGADLGLAADRIRRRLSHVC